MVEDTGSGFRTGWTLCWGFPADSLHLLGSTYLHGAALLCLYEIHKEREHGIEEWRSVCLGGWAHSSSSVLAHQAFWFGL